MSSLSMAGHLVGGPSAALQAARDDIYLEAATGNLIIRLASGTVLTITPAGGLIVPTSIVANGEDVGAAVDVLQAQVAVLGAPSPNQLANAGFEVNQRGGTVTANLAFAHDRWQNLLGGTSTATITDEASIVDTGSAHALKCVYVQGSAASQIDQKIEQFAQLRGRTVTFAIRVRKGVASSVRPYVNDSGTRTYGATDATTGAYTTMTVTAAIGAAAASVSVGVEASLSDTYYLDSAVFVVGSVAPPFAPAPPAEDMARCKRYYQEFGGLDLNEYVANLECWSSTVAGGAFVLPVEMAVAPVFSVSAAGDWALFNAAGSIVACTAVAAVNITRRSLRLSLTVASGLVAGNATVFLANTTLAARIRFEANP